MTKQNQYEWLIVLEGNSDIAIYNEYLNSSRIKISFQTISGGGKGNAINMSAWSSKNVETLRNDIGRAGFKGLILVVDSDDDSASPFNNYRRGDNSLYIGDKPTPVIDPDTKSFWLLDSLKGTKVLPVKGINVPRTHNGCLETDLLSAYGFPVEPQPEYSSFINIIKQATIPWQIPNKNDGNPWWEVNEKAKMDKFIYAALRRGFKVCFKEPNLPPEPGVITNLRTAMAS